MQNQNDLFNKFREPVIFDSEQSQAKKTAGMELAEGNADSDLDIARRVAVELSSQYGSTHADQVGEVLLAEYDIESLGPAAGSIFKGSHWEFTGQRIVSARVKNHGREIKVWRLKH